MDPGRPRVGVGRPARSMSNACDGRRVRGCGALGVSSWVLEKIQEKWIIA